MQISTTNASWNEVPTLQILQKIAKGPGVYIPKFGKSFSFGGPIPLSLHRWGWNLARRTPRLLRVKCHPHRCNVSHLRGENPQNCPLSNLNTGTGKMRSGPPTYWPASSHHSHTSSAPRALSSSITLHVSIHLWTTVEPSGPVWLLCQGTGTADLADRVTPGSGPLNLI